MCRAHAATQNPEGTYIDAQKWSVVTPLPQGGRVGGKVEKQRHYHNQRKQCNKRETTTNIKPTADSDQRVND